MLCRLRVYNVGMKPTTIRMPVIISAIVIVVVATGLAWFFINYKFVNNQLVKSTDVDYAELEQNFDKSYNDGDVDSQIQYADLMKKNGGNDNLADLYMAEALLQKGSLEYDEVANADNALAILNGLLVNDPTNPEILSAIGYGYEIKQDYNRALDYYNQAIKISDDDDTLFLRRGHAYDLMGNLRLAEVDYLKAYDLNADNESVKIDLARLYFRAQKPEDSFKFANDLLYNAKNSYIKAEASDLIGLMAIADEQYDSALEYFDYAINAYPDYPGAYLNYAYATLLKADMVKSDEEKTKLIGYAEEDIATALSIHQGSSFAVVLQGLIADLRKDPKTAQELYAKALTLVDSDISLGQTEKDSMRTQINSLIKK